MNGVGRRVSADATPDEGAAFADDFNTVSAGWDALSAWGRDEVHRLAELKNLGSELVPVQEWRSTFPASRAASINAYERLLGITLPRSVLTKASR
jgi:hypothetical protein